MLSVTGDERGLQDHGELKGSDEVKEYCVFGTVDSKNALPEAKFSGIALGEEARRGSQVCEGHVPQGPLLCRKKVIVVIDDDNDLRCFYVMKKIKRLNLCSRNL